MFLFLRHGALLTIVETKAQYEDALASEYVPFFQTKDAAYARAFYHAWHALSSLIADGRIDAGTLPSDTPCAAHFLQLQNEVSAAASLPEVRRWYHDPKEALEEDDSYMESAYILVNPRSLACKSAFCYENSCMLEVQGFAFIRIDTPDYADGFREGFGEVLDVLYDMLTENGYHAMQALLETAEFQEASLPISSERYLDQQTLKALYPAENVPDIHIVDGRKGRSLSPQSGRFELGYADGQRAARVFCRDLHAQSVSPMFLAVLCSAMSQ